ncbi:Uncharacterised protein [Mycobacteroides abscessus subsp. abscessus]|nr:Uncharacterised protein [Mycobacteroides abscessus subsp. abscessus]SHR47720.1 Uncharacterised protein [Mycobacteroides abscessus subsp. abscessus]SHR91955.1 Uncharacterised protein [Mycobacteroides abscessus subsp. abscessus]SHS27437.1 Uncharacterised protein [Mycobacteroides abscessus subsp. abscessus]SHU43840.1 Uncharacterised protein [Mycobacteroides abscessus subsp. abscessus]
MTPNRPSSNSMKLPGWVSACSSPQRYGELMLNSSSRWAHLLRSSSVPLAMISESFRPCNHSVMITFGEDAITEGT